MILPIICNCMESNQNQQIITQQLKKKLTPYSNNKFLISENYEEKIKDFNIYLKFKDNSDLFNIVIQKKIEDKTPKSTVIQNQEKKKVEFITEKVVKKKKSSKQKNKIKQTPQNIKNKIKKAKDFKQDIKPQIKSVKKNINKTDYKILKGDLSHDLIRDFILNIYNKEYSCSKFINEQNNISFKITTNNTSTSMKFNKNNINKLIGFVSNNLNTFICENYLNNNYPILNDNIFDFIKNSGVIKGDIKENIHIIEVLLINNQTKEATKIHIPLIELDENVKSYGNQMGKIISKISTYFNNDINFFKNLVKNKKRIIKVNSNYKLKIIKIIEKQKRNDVIEELLLLDFLKKAISKFINRIKIVELNENNEKLFISNIKKTLNNLVIMIFLFNILAD